VTGTTVNGGPPTSKPDKEFGVGLTAVYVEIPPSGDAEVVFKVHGHIDPATYALKIVRQPTITPDALHVDIQLPPSVSLTPSHGLTFDAGHLRGDTQLGEQITIANGTAPTNGTAPANKG
jgi:hypothetical protein